MNVKKSLFFRIRFFCTIIVFFIVVERKKQLESCPELNTNQNSMSKITTWLVVGFGTLFALVFISGLIFLIIRLVFFY